MTGFALAVLLGLTTVVLQLRTGARSPAGSAPPPGDTGPGDLPGVITRRLRGNARRIELHELPLFVHQLAGLLRAGRPPHGLWADMQRLHAEGCSTFSAAARPVLGSAERAADLGLSVPDAIREARARDDGRRHAGGQELDRMWVDLAGCVEVAERSGAPLANILEQYAAQLDAHLDGVAARETALAGPRATVVLLAWLPAVGLCLGFALGVNPFEVLTGSPLGLAVLVAGAFLMVAARAWSRALIGRAGGATS
jgi:tight adherence protein B